jgi:hypothetical protein
MASPPSSPSDSSLLAFAYDRDVDVVNYPPGHDQSQPQTPASDGTTHALRHSGRDVGRYSLSSLDPSPVSVPSKRPSLGGDEEREVGGGAWKGEDGSGEMDPFSGGELVVMSGSSLMVVVLIVVAVMLTLGKMTL